MNAVKRRASNHHAEIQCGGDTLDLERIRTQASRLNYHADKQETPKAERVNWVEVKNEKPITSSTKQTNASPLIEVRVGTTYTVTVPSGFDKTAFTEICEVLSGLCQ
jgi:hypothetical protein